MIDKIDLVVKTIGVSPYAVVAGLILSAFPVGIGLYRSVRAAFFVTRDAIQGNLSKRIRVEFFKNARWAFRVYNERRFDDFVAKTLLTIGSIAAVILLYMLAAISSMALVISFVPVSEINLDLKIKLILSVTFLLSTLFIIQILLRLVDMAQISQLRRRIIKKRTKK